ncbi:MAG TPA: trypsin-like peptidase domain-containing protein, partial [Verrucomicrobiae bacterium]|nr:trypsin-like peptidase domain-containing protein [Verrucomicrobiae bacterium]
MRLRLAACLSLIIAGSASADKPSPALELARQLNQAFVEVAEQVSPVVVVVMVAYKPGHENVDVNESPLWEFLPPELRKQLEDQLEERKRKEEEEPPQRQQRREKPRFTGQGSGVVLREDGFILTNGHVVDGAEKVKVRFKDGSDMDAEVRGVDKKSDIAVLKVDTKGSKLMAARLGDSDKLKVGEFAIAIGAPFEFDYSVTYGHVSAKDRTRVLNDRAMDQAFIQTDASINPGNSGGPLVNIFGEVIGINTLIRGLGTGIGFAIPINLAHEISDKLITDGKYVRAWLGVEIHALRDDPEYRDLVPDVKEGVVVKSIMKNGPAAKSDLKPSDIVMAVDGKPVATPQQLKNEIRSKTIGRPVSLEVHRKGKNIKVKLTPEAWPEDDGTPLASTTRKATPDKATSFGLTVQNITKELSKQFGVEEGD